MAKDDGQQNGNGAVTGFAGGPWWARLLGFVGIPGFLLFFILGGIPGLPSPLLKINELSADLKHHRKETRRLINVHRLMCRGVWQGSPADQDRCDEAAKGLTDEEPKQ